MKPCFNTITAGREKPLEEIIEQCGKVGFPGIEIDLNHIEEATRRIGIGELKRRLEDAGTKPVSIMAFDLAPLAEEEQAFDRFKRGVEAAKDLGSPGLLVYCATNVPAGTTIREAIDKAVQRARDYAEVEETVQIGLEPIGRTTLMGTPEVAMQIARQTGKRNVGIVMDSFHYYLAGVTDISSLPVDPLVIVHVNDAEDLPVDKLRDANRVHVGHGILPLDNYLSTLEEKGYDGYLSIEIFRPEYWAQPVERVVREAKESLEHKLEMIGHKRNP